MKLTPEKRRLLLFASAGVAVVAIFLYTRRGSTPAAATPTSGGASDTGSSFVVPDPTPPAATCPAGFHLIDGMCYADPAPDPAPIPEPTPTPVEPTPPPSPPPTPTPSYVPRRHVGSRSIDPSPPIDTHGVGRPNTPHVPPRQHVGARRPVRAGLPRHQMPSPAPAVRGHTVATTHRSTTKHTVPKPHKGRSHVA